MLGRSTCIVWLCLPRSGTIGNHQCLLSCVPFHLYLGMQCHVRTQNPCADVVQVGYAPLLVLDGVLWFVWSRSIAFLSFLPYMWHIGRMAVSVTWGYPCSICVHLPRFVGWDGPVGDATIQMLLGMLSVGPLVLWWLLRPRGRSATRGCLLRTNQM